MAKADIEITLHTEQWVDGLPQFQPGENLQGTAVILADEDVNCQRLLVQLKWHTEGRGTRYSEDIAEQALYQGIINSGLPKTFNFSLMLPEGPWSYQGHYVSVVWELQVKIDVSWARDPVETVNFVLRPLGSAEQENQEYSW